MTNNDKGLIRDCDLCKEFKTPRTTIEPAIVDRKTSFGPWAYLCEEHNKRFGIGPATILANVLSD